MTPVFEIIGACGVVLTVCGGAFAYVVHNTSKFSVDIAIALRDSDKALKNTETHTTQLAVTAQRIEGMEAVYADIRKCLEQIPAMCKDINELKTSVGILASKVEDDKEERRQRQTAAKRRKR